MPCRRILLGVRLHLFTGMKACPLLGERPAFAPLLHGVHEKQVGGVDQYESVRHCVPCLPFQGSAQHARLNPCPSARPGVASARATAGRGITRSARSEAEEERGHPA